MLSVVILFLVCLIIRTKVQLLSILEIGHWAFDIQLHLFIKL